MNPLTPAKMRVLHAVSVLYLTHGTVTYPMLEAELGITRGTVAEHLQTLKRLGLVEWERGKCGTLRPGSVS